MSDQTQGNQVAAEPDHIRDVFAADFRTLAKFVVEHPGDGAAVEALISDMARYRAESWTACMLEALQAGEATAEARIAEAMGQLQ